MKKSIYWLRAIACLLITNCHMKLLYPAGFQALGFGGYFGDCMFFIISGYCLTGCSQESLLHFSAKRLLRIYVPYLLYLPFSLVVRGMYGNFFELIFPIIQYHFLPTILTLYPLFYLCDFLHRLHRISFRRLWISVLAMQLIYYFLIYDFSYPVTADYRLLPMMSYFQMMLLGAQLRKSPPKLPGWGCLLAAAIALVLYVGLSVKPLQGYAAILQLYIGNLFAVSVSAFFLQKEARLPLPRIVAQLGKMTLEMYLVQVIIIHAYHNTPFPSGILMAWISIFAVARCLYCLSQWVRRKLPLPAAP